MKHAWIWILGGITTVAVAGISLAGSASGPAPARPMRMGGGCPRMGGGCPRMAAGAAGKTMMSAKSMRAACAAGKPCAMCASKKNPMIGKYLSQAIGRLDAASKAVATGDKKAALAAIAQARELVSASRKALEPRRNAPPKGVVNARCPMMNKKIDPSKVPPAFTRTYKGQKVGFCCGSCPRMWDKLSDTQKAAALKKASDTPVK